MKFNPPPGWPLPPGWSPPSGWTPDPSWPPAPQGWVLWVEDEEPGAASQPGSRLDDVLRRSVRWAQARTGQASSEEPPVVAEKVVGAGRWAGLANASMAFALARSGVPGAENALGLLRALYDIEDDQTRMLHSVEHNVRLLQEGPFLAGRLLLSEAIRLGPGDPDYGHMLSAAKDKFYDAQPLASSVQGRAVVEMNLGLVWQALGRPENARHWMQRSYESARVVIAALAKQAGDVKVLHSRWSTAALAYLYPAGVFVIPAKLKKVWGSERARDAIGAFLPFVNCVAASLNALSESSPVPALELTGSQADGFTLGEIPAQRAPAQRAAQRKPPGPAAAPAEHPAEPPDRWWDK